MYINKLKDWTKIWGIILMILLIPIIVVGEIFKKIDLSFRLLGYIVILFILYIITLFI